MAKHNRKYDQYKRQLNMLEVYLKGRIIQLGLTASSQPAEAPTCDAIQAELQLILDQVLPQMREVQS